jgi:hypothetical protein
MQTPTVTEISRTTYLEAHRAWYASQVRVVRSSAAAAQVALPATEIS